MTWRTEYGATGVRSYLDGKLVGETPYPPPKCSAKLVFSHNEWWRNLHESLLLPRPYYFRDGDYTNCHVAFGLWLRTHHADPVCDLGVELVIPPRLMWLARLLP